MRLDLNEVLTNLRSNKYAYIGTGSGRYVFDLGNGYVIKAAKNRKGFAQNKAEYQIASKSHSPLFANITQISEDYGLLIMERAEHVSHMSEVWKYFGVRNNSELAHVAELRRLCEKYGLLFADLRRTSSWGWVHDRLVIIDYGFTGSVRSKYYW